MHKFSKPKSTTPKKGKKMDIHQKAGEPLKIAKKTVEPLPKAKAAGNPQLNWAKGKKPMQIGTDRGNFGMK